MTHSPLRWGVLGTARINRSVIPPIRSSARHALVAVASRDLERAELYAREWRIPHAYGSYEGLLAAADVDAVYIPLPNALHVPWTLQAIRQGKHVLCEKPLALSAADVDAVAEAAGRAGVVVAEAFMYRHHAQTLLLKRLVDEGQIGALRLVRSAFSFTLTRDTDVRLDPALGGGSLWDVGCYPVSISRYLAGAEPIEVYGRATLGPTGIDEAFAGQLQFRDAIAQFDCGFRAPFRTHLEVVGTEGYVTVPVPFKPGVETRLFITRGGHTETLSVEGEPLYSGEVDNLADAVQMGRPSRVTLEDSRGNVAALVSLYESARTGAAVTVERRMT
jgi:D-xylose 1-dehydrogenase (NADP+, D-xylono-1,5-lactone-forming)